MQESSAPEMHTCAVCKLLDGDETMKDCLYCGVCGEWICISCRSQWRRRAEAAAKKMCCRGGK